MQQTFNPIDYGFNWTEDNWYTFDYDGAHKRALAARNKRARELRKRGHKVTVSTIKNQRITRGGIGSGKPEITQIVSIYMLNVRDDSYGRAWSYR